jgi:hypothetical protein
VRKPRGQPESVTDLCPDRVEVMGFKHGHPAAPLAEEKLAVLMACEYIQARAVSEVDVAREPVLLEHLEVAIDRGLVERESLGELRRGDRAVGIEQRRDHQPAGGRDPQAGAAQRVDRLGWVADVERGDVGGDGHRSGDCGAAGGRKTARNSRYGVT